MRHVLLLAAAIAPLVIVSAQDAAAQRGRDAAGGTFIPGGGGWRGGGWQGGGWQGGSGAWRGGAWGGSGWRGGGRYGGGGWRGSSWRGSSWHGNSWRGNSWRGAGWHGGGWGRPYVRSGWGWRRGWGHPGYYRGWDSGWGWGAAGLVAGAAIGAAAVSPYYADPYVYRYRVYAAPVSGAIGGYCATPVRTCQLIDLAVIGGGCSCRVAGGRARGTVVGP
ncbi:hypothetical protein [Bosea sp. 124]|uniref:hypothetical protein n=1 Tax=Bosea sp. 124 TaxID=2135642 RepID=UPI000D384BEC|nr:hypothetical protein [Bosea sp. 124]PTM43533.1 hypothetical protein C8D03_5150 [Bosea sp. 124]